MWPFKSMEQYLKEVRRNIAAARKRAEKQQLEEGRRNIAIAERRAEESINTPAVRETKRQAAQNWEARHRAVLEAKEKLMARCVRDGLSPEQIAKAESLLDQIGGVNEKNPWLEARE